MGCGARVCVRMCVHQYRGAGADRWSFIVAGPGPAAFPAASGRLTTVPPAPPSNPISGHGLGIWCAWDWWCYCIPRCHGRVAEWQTRWLQVPVSFGTWGFKSPFAHHERFYELQGRRLRTLKGFVTSALSLWGWSVGAGARFRDLQAFDPLDAARTRALIIALGTTSRRPSSSASSPDVYAVASCSWRPDRRRCCR